MKLRISSILLIALTAPVFAKPAPVISAPASIPVSVSAPSKFYVGIFGGGGSSSNVNASQYGTAYFIEAQGGPLALNSFGRINSKSASFFGAQVGYQAPEILLHASSQSSISPAIELEEFNMGNRTFSGNLVNNSVRLAERDFAVAYPVSRNIFLANIVVNFNNPCLMIHPYVGLGIGNAIMKVSGATAMQVNPVEANINHYNTNPSDSNSVFAGQIKLGLSYDINQYVSVFAEYRSLYTASTHFVFGSTVSEGHAETSSWQVSMGAQRYNLGDIGLRVNL